MSINVKNNRRRCYVYERTRSHSWILFLGEIVGGCYNPTLRQEEASTSVTESIATDSWLSTAAYTEEGSVGDSENLSTDVTNLCPKATLDHYKIMAGEPLTVADPAMGLLNNDEDADGGSLLISNFDSTSQQNGTVQVDSTGAFIFTHRVNFGVEEIDLPILSTMGKAVRLKAWW